MYLCIDVYILVDVHLGSATGLRDASGQLHSGKAHEPSCPQFMALGRPIVVRRPLTLDAAPAHGTLKALS